jgi:phage-related protein
MDEGKRINVRFYRTPGGSEPVREWLLSLSRQDRLAIGIDIKTVEFGWPVGLPVCRSLGDSLWEVRSTLQNRIARVLFYIGGDTMWLLHGFIKKQQKTPPEDLTLARKRLREVQTALSASRKGRQP